MHQVAVVNECGDRYATAKRLVANRRDLREKLHLEQVNIRKRLNKFVWIRTTFVQTAEF